MEKNKENNLQEENDYDADNKDHEEMGRERIEERLANVYLSPESTRSLNNRYRQVTEEIKEKVEENPYHGNVVESGPNVSSKERFDAAMRVFNSSGNAADVTKSKRKIFPERKFVANEEYPKHNTLNDRPHNSNEVTPEHSKGYSRIKKPDFNIPESKKSDIEEFKKKLDLIYKNSMPLRNKESVQSKSVHGISAYKKYENADSLKDRKVVENSKNHETSSVNNFKDLSLNPRVNNRERYNSVVESLKGCNINDILKAKMAASRVSTNDAQDKGIPSSYADDTKSSFGVYKSSQLPKDQCFNKNLENMRAFEDTEVKNFNDTNEVIQGEKINNEREKKISDLCGVFENTGGKEKTSRDIQNYKATPKKDVSWIKKNNDDIKSNGAIHDNESKKINTQPRFSHEKSEAQESEAINLEKKDEAVEKLNITIVEESMHDDLASKTSDSYTFSIRSISSKSIRNIPYSKSNRYIREDGSKVTPAEKFKKDLNFMGIAHVRNNVLDRSKQHAPSFSSTINKKNSGCDKEKEGNNTFSYNEENSFGKKMGVKTPFSKEQTSSVLSYNPNSKIYTQQEDDAILKNYTSKFKPLMLTPINVLYNPKVFYNSNKANVDPDSESVEKDCNDKNLLYGPGPVLTKPLKFTISSTVYNFKDGKDDTEHYIKIESDISWTVCKTLSEINKYVPKDRTKSSYTPLDIKIRNKVIETFLNTEKIVDLQAFILSNIVKKNKVRGSFLLMEDGTIKPFNFRLVGRALVSCNLDEKVHKIFLLEKCTVEPVEDTVIILRSDKSDVKLFASCRQERDCWVSDINEFIGKL